MEFIKTYLSSFISTPTLQCPDNFPIDMILQIIYHLVQISSINEILALRRLSKRIKAYIDNIPNKTYIVPFLGTETSISILGFDSFDQTVENGKIIVQFQSFMRICCRSFNLYKYTQLVKRTTRLKSIGFQMKQRAMFYWRFSGKIGTHSITNNMICCIESRNDIHTFTVNPDFLDDVIGPVITYRHDHTLLSFSASPSEKLLDKINDFMILGQKGYKIDYIL